MTLTLREAAQAVVDEAYARPGVNGGLSSVDPRTLNALREVLAQPDLDTPVLDLVDEWEQRHGLAYMSTGNIEKYANIPGSDGPLILAVRARRAGGTPHEDQP